MVSEFLPLVSRARRNSRPLPPSCLFSRLWFHRILSRSDTPPRSRALGESFGIDAFLDRSSSSFERTPFRMFFSTSDFARGPPSPVRGVEVPLDTTPCRKKRGNASAEDCSSSSDDGEGEVEREGGEIVRVESDDADALKLRGGVVRRRKKSPVKPGLDDLAKAWAQHARRVGQGSNDQRQAPLPLPLPFSRPPIAVSFGSDARVLRL